jgi:molybdopterin molybdotransferase
VAESNTRPAHDVRMQGFARRHTVAQALRWLDAQLQRLEAEEVPLRAAAGRVLAAPVVSAVDVPGFDRATMDGYAVVAATTEGATPYSRIALTVVGEAKPAAPFSRPIEPGDAVRIMTGAPMPEGADAVLPAEVVEIDHRRADRVFAAGEVPPSKNVGRRGEDIQAGTTVLEAGRLLRPQDVGMLSSIGLARVSVVRRPRVRVVVTGNELLPAGTPPDGFHITDANGPMLAALVERDGGVVESAGLVPDEENAILTALHADADVVIVSGGTSVGVEDLVPALLARHGELAVHGIAMRPSSPTGLGRLGRRLVFLIPGNPVSALCAYDFFAGRAIRALGGRPLDWPYRPVRGTLVRKISSPVGRLDYARVCVKAPTVPGGLARVEPLSVTGASILSSTTRADGFLIVPDDSEGFPAGTEVDVWLYA